MSSSRTTAWLPLFKPSSLPPPDWLLAPALSRLPPWLVTSPWWAFAPPLLLLDQLSAAGVVAVLARSSRKFRRPWKRTTLQIQHSSLGGVTESCLHAHLFTRLEDWTAADLGAPSASVPRDLSTLLNYGEPVLRSCPPPALSTVTPLCAHRTLTDQASGLPVYHSGGLLPPFPDLSTEPPLKKIHRASLSQASEDDKTVTMRAESFDDEDVNSLADTLVCSNAGPVTVLPIPAALNINVATPLTVSYTHLTLTTTYPV